MSPTLCSKNSNWADFESSCVRDAWATFLPLILTGLYLFYWVTVRLPWPGVVKKATNVVTSPFRLFISLEEAESYAYSQEKSAADANEGVDGEQQEAKGGRGPRAYLFFTLSFIQLVAFVVLSVINLVNSTRRIDKLQYPLAAIPWLYTALYPLIYSFETPPYNLFWLLFLQLTCGVLRCGGILYDSYVGVPDLPGNLAMLGYAGNIVVTLLLLWIIVSLPIAVPSKEVPFSKVVRVFYLNHFDELLMIS